MTELTLNKETHTYTVGKAVIPSVTQILAATRFFDQRFYTEYAATRGSYIHKATELYDRRELDEETLDDELRGYLAAWKLFLSQVKPAFAPGGIEKRGYSEIYGFAGTVDRVGAIDGNRAVIEIKSGMKLAAHAIQLAGYTILLDPIDYRGIRRYSVYLKQDGFYSLEQYTDKNDAKVFLSAVAVYKYQEAHK